MFVENMMHELSCDLLSAEFMKKCNADFYTGCCIMEFFLRMEVKQDKKSIKFHLVQETSAHQQTTGSSPRKTLCPKGIPTFPGVILLNNVCPDIPDQSIQKFY
jgi:hypothetical protein